MFKFFKNEITILLIGVLLLVLGGFLKLWVLSVIGFLIGIFSNYIYYFLIKGNKDEIIFYTDVKSYIKSAQYKNVKVEVELKNQKEIMTETSDGKVDDDDWQTAEIDFSFINNKDQEDWYESFSDKLSGAHLFQFFLLYLYDKDFVDYNKKYDQEELEDEKGNIMYVRESIKKGDEYVFDMNDRFDGKFFIHNFTLDVQNFILDYYTKGYMIQDMIFVFGEELENVINMLESIGIKKNSKLTEASLMSVCLMSIPQTVKNYKRVKEVFEARYRDYLIERNKIMKLQITK